MVYRKPDKTANFEERLGALEEGLVSDQKRKRVRSFFEVTIGKMAILGWFVFLLAGAGAAQAANVGWEPFTFFLGSVAVVAVAGGFIGTLTFFEKKNESDKQRERDAQRDEY